MAAASTAAPKKASTRKPKAEPTAGEIAKKVADEQEQKRLDALNDDSRKLGPDGGSMKRETAKAKPRKAGVMAAAEKVLRAADGPMSVKDILTEIAAKKLYEFSSAPTPPSTRLYVQLDAGRKRGKTVRVDKGVFDLAELNPKGAKKRPAK